MIRDTHHIVDLRSDTVTKPSPEMRQAIAAAEVGDDVLGDDPTVIRLQEKAAHLLGKEAALYTPSGSMANQIAIRLHCRHGDEVICHKDSHAFFYESGAPAALAGVTASFLSGARGQFDGADLQAVLRPADSHFPPARLVILENTHNRGGGSIWPPERIADVSTVARDARLALHLDGARLMNACVATGQSPQDYTKYFDTVSMCFSKGLGAPVGSVIAGPADLIATARRYRKMLGGTMRQVGILAAAAIYALEHNVERLVDDHANARKLALGLAELPGIALDVDAVETNMVFFDVAMSLGTAPEVCRWLEQEGVLMLPETPSRVRAVTHLDVSAKQIDDALQIISRVLRAHR